MALESGLVWRAILLFSVELLLKMGEKIAPNAGWKKWDEDKQYIKTQTFIYKKLSEGNWHAMQIFQPLLTLLVAIKLFNIQNLHEFNW